MPVNSNQLPLNIPTSLSGNLYDPSTRIFQPFLLDLETCDKLVLQTLPLELSYSPEMTWATISSAGRNNPLYQYTGGEDSINFTISWYANEESREDVLRSCKWLEALGRNDGYDKRPHRVKFIWGKLFQDATWIVVSAQYRLSMFSRIDGMLPCLAIQEVTLKRITDGNRGLSDIHKITT